LFEQYTQFSYFVELYRGWYEERPEGRTYVIAEKDRRIEKDDNFPLRYGQELSGLYTSDYWQDCRRNRDIWYLDKGPTVGMDFASFAFQTDIPRSSWTGMMHHSQFKCVQVVSDETYSNRDISRRHIQSIKALGEPASTEIVESDLLRSMINTCELTDVGIPPVLQPNPRDPVMTCEASLPSSTLTDGLVRWAVVRPIPMDQYYRGCMLQCAGKLAICPGTAPGASSQPCYSVCGNWSANSGPAKVGGGGYSLRGEVPVAPLALPTNETLTSESEEGGYRLRSTW
jgi:hypothetical protein